MLGEENECLKMQHSSTLESVKVIQSEYQTTQSQYQTLKSEYQTVKTELDELSKEKTSLTEKHEVSIFCKVPDQSKSLCCSVNH